MKQYKTPALALVVVLASACGGGLVAPDSSSSSASSSSSTSSSSSSSGAAGSGLSLQERSPGVCTEGVFENLHAGFTGDGYVNPPNARGAHMDWSLRAAASGQYALELRFANGAMEARSGELKINGGSGGRYEVPLPSTGGWSTWQTVTVLVDLVQGENLLELHATGLEGLANIDFLKITGAGLSAGRCSTASSSSSSSSSSTSSGMVAANGCPLIQEGFSTLNGGTTGGAGGETVTVTNSADLKKYASADEPYIIKVKGTIKISPKGEELFVKSNKTIIGVGSTGRIVEGGFRIDYAENIIIRNLYIGDTYKADDHDGKQQDWDGIQIDVSNNIWLDHIDFNRIGDGMIDSRKDTTNLTVSWNKFRNHNKTFGIGWTDNLTAEITIHHNWFHNVETRNPSTDNVLHAHLYNNWLDGVAKYGNWARGGTHMVLENSVFEGVKDPHYYDSGSLVARGNIYGAGNSGQKESSGSAYQFFDPNTFYPYNLDPAAEVKSLLKKCAGPRAELGL